MSNFSSGEVVKWVTVDREMVILDQRKKDKEGRKLLDGPWWVCCVPGKRYLKAVVHDSKMEKI